MNQVSNNPFHKAAKTQARLRMAIYGASGAGKTYSALAIAKSFGKIALIDTERGSASKYADIFEFDVVELSDPHPARYIETIKAAGAAGYDVLIIDSLSHAWQKVLEIVDDITRKSQSKNSYLSWRDVTPLQNQFVDAMLTAPLHIIATMRSKTEYALDKDDRGKLSPRKIGLAPIQRDGIEYEFDVVAEMNADNDFIVTKTRCPALNGVSVNKPGDNVGSVLKAWLTEGAPMPPPIIREVPREPEPAPASVRGAGIAQPRPAAAPAPQQPDPLVDFGTELGATTTMITATDPREAVSDDDPNVRHVDHVIISRSKGATQVAFAIVNSHNRIPVIGEANISKLTDLFVGDTHIMALTIGTHELVPTWKVYADHDKDGWHISKIETGIPLAGVTE